MEIMSIVISCISVLLALIVFVVARNKDVKANAIEQGKLTQTLEMVVRNTNDIVCNMNNVKGDVTEVRERVVRVEESTKAAHKRLDEYFNKKEF